MSNPIVALKSLLFAVLWIGGAISVLLRVHINALNESKNNGQEAVAELLGVSPPTPTGVPSCLASGEEREERVQSAAAAALSTTSPPTIRGVPLVLFAGALVPTPCAVGQVFPLESNIIFDLSQTSPYTVRYESCQYNSGVTLKAQALGSVQSTTLVDATIIFENVSISSLTVQPNMRMGQGSSLTFRNIHLMGVTSFGAGATSGGRIVLDGIRTVNIITVSSVIGLDGTLNIQSLTTTTNLEFASPFACAGGSVTVANSAISALLSVSGASFDSSDFFVSNVRVGKFDWGIKSGDGTAVRLANVTTSLSIVQSFVSSSFVVSNCDLSGAGTRPALELGGAFGNNSFLHVQHSRLNGAVAKLIVIGSHIGSGSVHRFSNNNISSTYANTDADQGLIWYTFPFGPLFGGVLAIENNTFSARMSQSKLLRVDGQGGQILYDRNNRCNTTGSFSVDFKLPAPLPSSIAISAHPSLKNVQFSATTSATAVGTLISLEQGSGTLGPLTLGLMGGQNNTVRIANSSFQKIDLSWAETCEGCTVSIEDLASASGVRPLLRIFSAQRILYLCPPFRVGRCLD